jgi:hypothetical protein
MKNLKLNLLAFVMTAFMATVSTAALAEASEGRIVYAAADALDLIEGKLHAAIEGITKGADNEQASKLIKEALDATKEFNSEANGPAVQRANGKLKQARINAGKGFLQEAEQELRDSLKLFQGMRDKL